VMGLVTELEPEQEVAALFAAAAPVALEPAAAGYSKSPKAGPTFARTIAGLLSPISLSHKTHSAPTIPC